jgi:hypothetical protein
MVACDDVGTGMVREAARCDDLPSRQTPCASGIVV